MRQQEKMTDRARITNKRKLSNIPNLLRLKTNEMCYLDNRGTDEKDDF